MSQHALAVRIRCRRRILGNREVGGQFPDSPAPGLVRRVREFVGKPVALGFGLLHGAQRIVPLLFQRCGDEAVARVDLPVAPAGQVGAAAQRCECLRFALVKSAPTCSSTDRAGSMLFRLTVPTTNSATAESIRSPRTVWQDFPAQETSPPAQ
ncbi:MAG: hypothetical protein OXI87_13120 [Albidovulum sp.]|nr:hypothetical protein [Albidovulum sp.]MDE0534405.1 hypothetical protein [Albidovulum sp.]